jgi:hypothetical protein
MLQSLSVIPAAIAGGTTACLGHADVVAQHGVEADHPGVRLNLFAEAVRQPRGPAHAHAEVQVLPSHLG